MCKNKFTRILLVANERDPLKFARGIKKGVVYLFTKLNSSEVNLAPGIWDVGGLVIFRTY